MPANNIALRVRFFMLDGFIAAPLLIMMLYPRKSTLYILLFFSVILFILERRGLPLPMLTRKIRVFIVGRKRYIRPFWRE